MKLRTWLFLLVLPMIFVACNTNETKVEDGAVARAFNAFLLETDLAELHLELLEEEDSIARMNAFINKWLTDKVLEYEAKQNLSENQDLDAKVEAFRNSLLIFEYQKAILKQQLDTIVQMGEIEEYYQNHGSDFQLNEDIVKVNFLVLPTDAKNIRQVKQFLEGDEDDDIRALSDYARRNAELFHLNTDVWISLKEILETLSVELKSSEIINNNLVQKKNNDKIYLIKFHNVLRKGQKSPIEFEKERIKTNILNQRKLDILEKMKEDLLKKASSNNSVEIF